jgi:hypothetical protein
MNQIWESVIMIGGAIFFVVLGMVIVPYAEKKGWIRTKNIDLTEQMLGLVKALISKNLTNKDLKSKITQIYDSIVVALKFVQNVSGVVDINQKKKLVFNMTVVELNRLGIIADDDDKLIIKIIIDNAIDLLKDEEYIQ